MVKRLVTGFAAGAIGILVMSCRHQAQIAEPPPPVPDVCFQTKVLPVFNAYCGRSGCHSTASQQGTYILNSYTNIISHGLVPGNASVSIIYQLLLSTGTNKMPKPGYPDLTAAQITDIKNWINGGAKNTANCSAACDSTKFKYAADIKPLMETYCNGCHAGSNAQGGVELNTYLLLQDQAINNPDAIIEGIKHTPGYAAMPKYGALMNSCDIKKIENWINAGALNN